MPLNFHMDTNTRSKTQKILWILVGSSIVLLIVYASVTFEYPYKHIIVSTSIGDFLMHFFSYGLVMFSFCFPLKAKRTKIIIGFVLFFLSILLEVFQMYAWKSMRIEMNDILGNTLGIAAGFFFAGLKK
jgi:VanZ family protein